MEKFLDVTFGNVLRFLALIVGIISEYLLVKFALPLLKDTHQVLGAFGVIAIALMVIVFIWAETDAQVKITKGYSRG